MSRSLCDESITHTWRQLKDSIIFREFFNLDLPVKHDNGC